MKKITVFLILLLTVTVFASTASASWNDYNRAVALIDQGRGAEAIPLLVDFAEEQQNAGIYRRLATAYEMAGQYQNAANTLYKEADLHRARGDMNTYHATRNKADLLNSEVDVFFEREGKRGQSGLGKYEPETGMYVGAYIEQDALSQQPGNRFAAFNQATGKNHAVYFVYHRHGDPFPTQLAENLKQQGAALQLAMQPEQGLGMIQDDAYLRQFARDARDSGIPVFLRYASEMNGDWVIWGGNPQAYIEKFRLVSDVMRQEAPNVAMVWAPNATPASTIHDYYPGDAYVDWVGVNFYSVPFFNGDPNQPADGQNPLDLMDEVYDNYADRKPMMIAETATSHFTSVGNQDVTDFGVTKMRMLYHGLQMKYPRVKAVHWFSVDTLTATYVNEGRRLNNFSLSANERMMQAYRTIMQDPYFLSDVVNGPGAAAQDAGRIVDHLDGEVIRQDLRGMGFSTIYDPSIDKVVYRLNGQYLSESASYPFRFSVPHASMQNGTNTLEAVVFDSTGREAVRERFSFTKGSSVGTLSANELKLFIDDPVVYTETGGTRLLARPFVTDGVTQVPLRFISETMGADVHWNGAARQITIEHQGTTIVMTVGQQAVRVGSQTQTLSQAPVVLQGTTFVPLRFVSETLGAEVHYEAADRSVQIRFSE